MVVSVIPSSDVVSCSFMLHQIRKMIGLAIAIMRGYATIETLKRCFHPGRVDIPKAPGLGLMLEEVHYDRYNKVVSAPTT